VARAREKDVDFRSWVDRYSEKYAYPRDAPERGLEAFAAHLFAMEEGFDRLLDGEETFHADLADYILRGNDLGVDVVLEDEENSSIILVQAGWSGKQGPSEDKVASFFDKPASLSSPSYIARGGPEVIELLGAFPEKLADGWDISLRFVTNKRIGEDSRLRELVDAKNLSYQEAGKSITCELYGETEVMQRYKELTTSSQGAAVPSAEFNIPRDQKIEMGAPDMPYKTLLCVIKGTELAALYRRKGVGNRLFNLNIRLPLASRKINPAIQSTASSDEEAPNFFYYNNGISAVCSDFTVDDTRVTASRLQIINGAQTVYSLVKAHNERKLEPETKVLMRLTATAENYGGAFTDKVIAYNNTQNPVKASDFFSNDPLHRFLKAEFDRRAGKGAVPKFDYVFKSGMTAARGHKALKTEEVANIRHAFLYGPTISYKEPKSFFQLAPEGRYEEAFGLDGKRVDEWPPEEAARFVVAYAITRRVADIATELKKGEKSKLTNEAKYLFRSARYMAALVAVGLEVIVEETFKDYETLSNSRAQFERYVDPLLLRARDLFESAIAPRYATAQQPEYNFLRDASEWSTIRTRMEDAVNTGRVKFT
jgi:hypothetical protein